VIIFEIVSELDIDLFAKVEIQLQIIEKIFIINKSFNNEPYYDKIINSNINRLNKILHRTEEIDAIKEDLDNQYYNTESESKINDIIEKQNRYDSQYFELSDLFDKKTNLLLTQIVSLIRTANIEKFNKLIVWVFSYNKKGYGYNQIYFDRIQQNEIIRNISEKMKIKYKKNLFELFVKSINTWDNSLSIAKHFQIKTLMRQLNKNFKPNEKFLFENINHIGGGNNLITENFDGKSINLHLLLKYLIKWDADKKKDEIIKKVGESWYNKYYKNRDLSYPDIYYGDYYYYDLLLDLKKYTGDDDDLDYILEGSKYIPSFYHRKKIDKRINQLSQKN